MSYDNSGKAFTDSTSFTNQERNRHGCLPSSAGISICSPTPGGTYDSPITVSAGAYTGAGYIAAIRIYIDNVAVALLNNSQKSKSFTINQAEPVSSGKHDLVVAAYPIAGGSASGQEYITVK